MCPPYEQTLVHILFLLWSRKWFRLGHKAKLILPSPPDVPRKKQLHGFPASPIFFIAATEVVDHPAWVPTFCNLGTSLATPITTNGKLSTWAFRLVRDVFRTEASFGTFKTRTRDQKVRECHSSSTDDSSHNRVPRRVHFSGGNPSFGQPEYDNWGRPNGLQPGLLVGRSGAGKTTIMHFILGLLKADKGAITIWEQEINSLDLDSVRQNIACVPSPIPIFFHSLSPYWRMQSQGNVSEFLLDPQLWVYPASSIFSDSIGRKPAQFVDVLQSGRHKIARFEENRVHGVRHSE